MSNVTDTEALTDAGDAGDNLLGHHCRVGLERDFAQTDVARSARFGGKLLAKMLDQHAVPALTALGIGVDLFGLLPRMGQQLTIDSPLLEGLLGHVLPHDDIAARM